MSKWNSDFQAWEPDKIDSAAESELLLKHAAGNASTSDRPHVKPLSGATIKRHALKGISSAQDKQLSTSPRRGK